MHNRIKELRKNHLELSQKEFASRLGMSENYIWMIEKGTRVPPDRTIADICRVFGVDRVWLETGVGEPFRPESRDDKIAKALGEALGGSQKSRARLIRALAELPEELFPAAEEIICQIADLLSNE